MMRQSDLAVHSLESATSTIYQLLQNLEREYRSAESSHFLAEAPRIAFSSLPLELVRTLTAFRHRETSAVVIFTGLPLDDVRIGPTPANWNSQPDPRSTLREELFLVLLGSLLGEIFGWATLQDGRLIQNVLPIASQEHEQSGHGSRVSLAWHTEDGFHPFRCDYLGLLALRNEDRVPTTVACVDGVSLSTAHRRTLSEPRFIIRPDNEHLYQRSRDRQTGAETLPSDWVEPLPAAVLFGDPNRPYLRIDPYFMSAIAGDDEAEAALASITRQLDLGLNNLVLDPGTVCFIDNYRAVHGRRAFAPSYNGRDRWLKKITVTRDLRRSRAARAGPDVRVLRPDALSEHALLARPTAMLVAP
jgi:L-asparagine oxygenase